MRGAILLLPNTYSWRGAQLRTVTYLLLYIRIGANICIGGGGGGAIESIRKTNLFKKIGTKKNIK
jgi:hypothetical protein